MTDETLTPVDPARVHAVLAVLGWPDDREDPAIAPEPLDCEYPLGQHWRLAEDAIRAADAAKLELHVIEIHPVSWRLMHPLSCGPVPAACPVWLVAVQDLAKFEALGGIPPGQYECEINDLGDRLRILDRVDVPEATDG